VGHPQFRAQIARSRAVWKISAPFVAMRSRAVDGASRKIDETRSFFKRSASGSETMSEHLTSSAKRPFHERCTIAGIADIAGIAVT